MQRGDVLLMNALAPHRGQVNNSYRVRWSMDLRFQRTGTPTGREHHPKFIVKSKKHPDKIVTADRVKRSEGLFFKLLYECHKILTFIFTGRLIKFGNYSCLPKEDVAKLVKEACIWSSFSGSVMKIISDRASVPSIRG